LQKNIWWKEAVAYQIYPRSFQDSNGDGIGDIPGVIARLDYLKNLGIDLIWICPIYKSPQDDNGYDISDYQAIHSEFGKMQDFDRLLKEVHQRGMKLIIDLVINHTSDEHPWFVESRASKNSKKRDWYIWKDGKSGGPPNNWESIFSGSAWEFDSQTEQYYLHLFSKKQPDLNWENPEVRENLYSMIRWWMEKGIDGFRIDAISHIKKAPGFPDLPNPEKKKFVPSFTMHMNVPGIQKHIQELCEKTFQKFDVVTVGEANGVSSIDALEWVGEDQKKFHMLFQFEHIGLWNKDSKTKIDLPNLKKVFKRWQNDMENGGWNALYIENHDIIRAVSKWGNPEKFWNLSATALAAMYFLMKGTPFIYQGQEIGMTNSTFDSLDSFQDVSAKNWIAQKLSEGLSKEKILAELSAHSRDNSRTPMQWSGDAFASFSTKNPWLPVNKNYPQINVENQANDPHSILHFYKRLIQLRKEKKGWIYGKFDLVLENHPNIFAYSRTHNDWKSFVLCNFSEVEVSYSLDLENSKFRMGNYPTAGAPGNLRAFETQIFQAN
jgi:alpha-glucosidase